MLFNKSSAPEYHKNSQFVLALETQLLIFDSFCEQIVEYTHN